MPAYVSLPTSSEDDSEAKLLEKSSTEDFPSFHARVPSSKILGFFYGLCALAVILAGINVAAGVKTLRHIQATRAPIDTLPQPDIFVGLPKIPKTHMDMGGAASHSHEHNHGHSHD